MNNWRERLHALHNHYHHVFAIHGCSAHHHFQSDVGYACFSSEESVFIVFTDDGQMLSSKCVAPLRHFIAYCEDDASTDFAELRLTDGIVQL
jgi:hypothetical protein